MADRHGIFTTIPCWNIKDEGYFKEKMLELFEKDARGFMDREFHIREIEEGDLSLENWNLPPDNHFNWSGTTWVNHPLTGHEAVMIYGVSSAKAILSVKKLIFLKASGHMIIGRNDLSELQTLETALRAIRECSDQEWLMETFGGSVNNIRMEGYFQQPYIYKPLENVSIGIVYLPNMEPGELKLMGYIAETVGKSIA